MQISVMLEYLDRRSKSIFGEWYGSENTFILVFRCMDDEGKVTYRGWNFGDIVYSTSGSFEIDGVTYNFTFTCEPSTPFSIFFSPVLGNPVLMENFTIDSFPTLERIVQSFSSASSSSFPSLNGKYGSLPDGTEVTVTGKKNEYTVVSSEMLWNDSSSSSYMIVYVLKDEDDLFMMAPDVSVKEVA
ncbi:hypothetical protein [Sulfurospirillum barnesii]|uniref:Uncharacterized protein n=1 Tax=Sulfurospirillum barnesii (strain ATCC 700032 / DSM 10660 / SES-3) TaxID=760154 RepID=I3Y0N9_SULBS|nr:hypothetical protein [Sulfurospirillum barnesii]AFL69763.1 hypothetical protein Sulba_2496 [Sulfurospirillum barnesii SES-3]